MARPSGSAVLREGRWRRPDEQGVGLVERLPLGEQQSLRFQRADARFGSTVSADSNASMASAVRPCALSSSPSLLNDPPVRVPIACPPPPRRRCSPAREACRRFPGRLSIARPTPWPRRPPPACSAAGSRLAARRAPARRAAVVRRRWPPREFRQREQCRRDLRDAAAAGVAAARRRAAAPHQVDAVVGVPLRGRGIAHARQRLGPSLGPLEAVIGSEHEHRALALGQLAVLAEHAIDPGEIAFSDAAVVIEVRRRDRRLPRRRIGREHVTDRVGALDVDRREVRLRASEISAGETVVDVRLDQHAPQRANGMPVRLLRGDCRAVLVLGQPRQELAQLREFTSCSTRFSVSRAHASSSCGLTTPGGGSDSL